MNYIPKRNLQFSLMRTVPPVLPVVTLEEARLQLRVDTSGSPPSNPEDSLIESLVKVATEDLDAGTGWLGRALAPQTWRLTLDRFPPFNTASASLRIFLPYPPLIEVESFTYVDTAGDTVAFTEGDDFRVSYMGTEGLPSLLPIADDWPNAKCEADSIVITYRCGYVTGSPETLDVPELIRNYIKSRLTDLYDSRGVDANGMRSKVPDWVTNSLEQFRIMRVYP